MAFILDQLNIQCAVMVKVAEDNPHNRSTMIVEPVSISINIDPGVDSTSDILPIEVISIIEEAKPSKCLTVIKGIADIDPLAACLLNLLSKPRPSEFNA